MGMAASKGCEYTCKEREACAMSWKNVFLKIDSLSRIKSSRLHEASLEDAEGDDGDHEESRSLLSIVVIVT